MRRTGLLFVAAGLAMLGAIPAAAQNNAPPVITNVAWGIYRNIGGDPSFGPFDPPLNLDPTPFNPNADLARELDLITLDVTVVDPDFTEEADDQVYYLKQTAWIPYDGYLAPEPPVIGDDQDKFLPEEEGLSPAAGQTSLTIPFVFQVPAFDGQNQAKLRGRIPYDVRWILHLMVSNTQDPGCTTGPYYYSDGYISYPCDEAVNSWDQLFYAVENPVLIGPNPPAFADAGADRTVPAGYSVILDGSRSIDNYNRGFDVGSTNVFDKDTLTYTWEWVSGPVRVDPVQDSPHDPQATVKLDVPNDPSDPHNQYYEYRLTVDDNVNALPTQDSVRITVVDELPTENPPVAIIEGPASARPVGSIITLVSRSYDPDRPDDPNGVLLSYRWQQTNELGGPLSADELQEAFQPLGGMTEKTASWQALKVGTYYFRLLVDDDLFRSSAQFSVEVIPTETAGAEETAGNGASSGDTSSTGQDLAAPTACGAGMLPVAITPLALCLLRRRLR